MKKNGIRLCDGNSVVSRFLSLKEVSEYNGIVRIIVRSVCKQFDRANGLSIFQFDAIRFIDFSAKDFDQLVQWFRDSCFVFNF